MDTIRDFDEFTEEGFQGLVRAAAAEWRFVPYWDCSGGGKVCLWRHDVDASMHRALALAGVEAEANVAATYFLYPHSPFYNLLETGMGGIVARMVEMGHFIGLHFDPGHYGINPDDKKLWEETLLSERRLLERSFGQPVRAFSLHNPAPLWMKALDAREEAGMVNAYHPDFLGGVFRYVSDSNGYWRYRPLRKILLEGKDEKLHVLTHPEWWTPEALSPRERIERAVHGRAERCLKDYDALLARHGRNNIR